MDLLTFIAEMTKALASPAADLERALRQAAGPAPNTVPLSKVLDDLLSKGALQPETANAVRGLQQLRNLAAHAPEEEALPPARVASFATMAAALRWTIKNNLKHVCGRSADGAS
ncbi:MAG: hypothetical protein ACLP1X_04265 [Polyangiaceae bacterium]